MPELNSEDLRRVDSYLKERIHQVERKQFRPLMLLALLVAVLGLLTGIAWLIARKHGVL